MIYKVNWITVPESKVDELVKKCNNPTETDGLINCYRKLPVNLNFKENYNKMVEKMAIESCLHDLANWFNSVDKWTYDDENSDDDDDEIIKNSEYVRGKRPCPYPPGTWFKVYFRWEGNQNELKLLDEDLKKYPQKDFTFTLETKYPKEVLGYKATVHRGKLNYSQIRQDRKNDARTETITVLLSKRGILKNVEFLNVKT